LAQSVADFAGVQGDSISYTFVDNGESCHIDVFDDDAEGNGSTQLAHKYFHIPIEVRELAKRFDDRNLPSVSFMDTLERNLQMCPEHVLHSICLSEAPSAPSRTPAWMANETLEVRDRYSRSWEGLGVRTTREASLHNRRRFAIADADGQTDLRTRLLDLELSLSLCDVGCPACSGDDFGNLFPPHLTEMAACRAVLDDVLGDWSDNDGYLRHHADDSRLKALSGENVPSGAFIHVKGDAPGSLSRVQSFVQFPSPPVGFAWTRGMAVPDKMDFWVRHLELL